MRLARHRANTAHLPHQPFLDRDPVPVGGAVKPSGLARKVHQNRENRAGFEDRDRRTVRAVRIDDGRHPVVWRDLQEIGRKLLTSGNVDQMGVIGQPHLFQSDGDFPAIWRRPEVEIDWMCHKPLPVLGRDHDAFCPDDKRALTPSAP